MSAPVRHAGSPRTTKTRTARRRPFAVRAALLTLVFCLLFFLAAASVRPVGAQTSGDAAPTPTPGALNLPPPSNYLNSPVQNSLGSVLEWLLDAAEGIVIGGGILFLSVVVILLLYYNTFTGNVRKVEHLKSLIPHILVGIFVFQIFYSLHRSSFPVNYLKYTVDYFSRQITDLVGTTGNVSNANQASPTPIPTPAASNLPAASDYLGNPVQSHLGDALGWLLDAVEGLILGSSIVMLGVVVIALLHHVNFTGNAKKAAHYKSLIPQILIVVFIFQVFYSLFRGGFPTKFADHVTAYVNSQIAAAVSTIGGGSNNGAAP
jgi:hypothetical protein